MGGGMTQSVARSYLAYDLTGSAKVLGVVVTAQLLPLLVLSLFGGAVADRVDRRKLIMVSQLTSVLNSFFIAISITTGTITWYHLVFAGIVSGAVWAFLGPARQAAIPQLVGQANMNNAVALQGAGMSAMALMGPAVGGLLYALIGPDGVSYFGGALILGALLFTSRLPALQASQAGTKSRMVHEIKEGFAYIRTNRIVMLLLGFILVTILVVQPFPFLLPILVQEAYDRESVAYGVMVSMMGLGSLVGTLALASLGRWKRGMLLLLANMAAGLSMIVIGVVGVYYVAVVMMLAVGLSEASRRVLNQALLIDLTDEKFQGRVMSIYVMSFGLMPLGVLPASLLADLIGSQTTAIVLGVTVTAVTVGVLLTQRSLRALQ